MQHSSQHPFVKRRTMNTSTQLKTILSFLVACGVGCFALLSRALAVVPAPGGGYPGGNTAEGQSALLSLTSGTFNTAVGVFSLLSNTEGQFNTAIGAGTLLSNTENENTATGAGALLSNTTGGGNTANGAFALFSNTEGNTNTANGDRALFSNTTGSDNTATGFLVLHDNTTGSRNTANGDSALLENTTGNSNTANGFGALLNNATGDRNTATGNEALLDNTTGNDNTAVGNGSLHNNTIGVDNTAIGVDALSNNTDSNNTAEGVGALRNKTTGLANTALGFEAGINLIAGNDNIYLGSFGPSSPGDESNTIRIGTPGDQTKTFIAGINSALVSGGAVIVNGAGQLGIEISSTRFKDEIRPMGIASEAILALRPVTFRYKSEIDPDRTPQFGLVAEEVEKVNPDLIIRDPSGKAYTVRYDAVNAMLLNEFLKERKKVEEQQATIGRLKAGAVKQEAAISELKKNTEVLTAELKKQATQIQKVSTEVKMRRSATSVVLNP
jgi:hypothetical protein